MSELWGGLKSIGHGTQNDPSIAAWHQVKRGRKHLPFLHLHLVNAKIPAQFTELGQERAKQQYGQPRFPLDAGTWLTANSQPGVLLQKTNLGQTCLIFHIPSNLSASVTGRSEIWWNKSDVCSWRQFSRRWCYPAFSLIILFSVLPFTSKLMCTNHIFFCSRSSPEESAEPWLQGPRYSTAVSLIVPALPHTEGELLA